MARQSPPKRPFTFLQISDSHVGFNKPANPDALGTLREAVGKVRALSRKPAFMIHTGDITHLSKPAEFDNAGQLIGEARLDVHYVPGEHDFLDEGQGKAYLARYGKGPRAQAGTASMITACTSSVSSMSSTLRLAALAGSGQSSLPGFPTT